MHRFLMTIGIVLWGGLACVSSAAEAKVPASTAGRSPLWRQAVALAANDPARVGEAMKRVTLTTDEERAAFVADVLFLVQSKPVVDAGELNRDLAAVAGALAAAADASGNGKVVLDAIAKFVVGTGVTGDTLLVTPAMNALISAVESQLPKNDRAAFAADVIGQVAEHKTPDTMPQARAMGAVAVARVAGASDQKPAVIAEIFAVTPAACLTGVTAAFADVFNQRQNNLTNEAYQQVAKRILDAVAARLVGVADAKDRYAYALAAFIASATVPADFKTNLLAAIPQDILTQMGTTREAITAVVQADQAAVAAAQAAAPSAQATGVLGNIDPITTTGQKQNVTVEQGPAFTHENRPPRGYQNQGI